MADKTPSTSSGSSSPPATSKVTDLRKEEILDPSMISESATPADSEPGELIKVFNSDNSGKLPRLASLERVKHGGIGNFTYRGVKEEDGVSVIIKFYHLYIAHYPEVSLRGGRWHDEFTATFHTPPFLTPHVTSSMGLYCHTPTPSTGIVVFADAGPHLRTLHDIAVNLRTPHHVNPSRYGAYLAAFQIFAVSSHPSATALRETLTPHERPWWLCIYDKLAQGFTGGKELAEKIQDHMKQEMLQPGFKILVHGDYSPRNMLRDPDDVDGNITVLDWELCTQGPAWQDLGQCAGETWLGKCDVEGFLRAYVERIQEGQGKIEITKEMVKCAVIHAGIFGFFWTPMMGWIKSDESEEEAAKRREVASRWIMAAWEDDWRRLKETCWKPLVKDEWV